MSNDQEESQGYSVTIPLSPTAIEVLYQLFLHGPTYDGNVISKQARDELFDLKLIGRHNGYQFLLVAGVRLVLQNGMDRKKETQMRREREQRSQLEAIKSLFVPPEGYAMDASKQVAQTQETDRVQQVRG